MSFLTSFLAKFIAPEEHALGQMLAAAYASNKAEVVAALGAGGVTASTAVTSEVHKLIDEAFNVAKAKSELVALVKPIIEPQIDNIADAYVTKVVAAAGGEGPVVEAFADKLVGEVVAALEAA